MQQLNLKALLSCLDTVEDKVIIRLPLPTTIDDTNSFIAQLAECTESHIVNSEWGADRHQSTFEKTGIYFYLHIEWLCEAMWIEATHSDYDGNQLVNLLAQ